MAVVNLNLGKSLFVPKFFPLLQDYSHRWEFYMGSAGSAKSYFITQKCIYRALREPVRILVCRRYGTTLRQTCFQLFKNILKQWNILSYVKVRETDFNIKFPNGSEIIFCGLDDETKLLSLADISVIFIEEAFEVPQDTVEQLNLRMRGAARNQQILMAWNPISQDSWLYDFTVVHPPQNSLFIHSTYKDNPFLSDEYIRTIEELKTRNPSKWRVFGLGEWGIDTDGLVFSNFREESFDLSSVAGLERRAGSDLGFVDATTILDTYYDRENKRIYVWDEFYKSGCQLDEIAEQLTRMELKHTRLYMDSAEPRSISYFKKNGFSVTGSIKGKDSVKAGIMFLQNHEIIVHPRCCNLLKELRNFSFVKDKKTGKYSDNFTHEYSHAIDGLRYAYSDIYTKGKLRTLDKSVLGL